MIINQTITKKILENLVHQTFLNLGNISSSALLDSLKLLGFYYATNAGISINIEDLKTPNSKKQFINTAYEEVKDVSYQWQQGLLSDNERFQTIIDSWNNATESLKNRIVDYYQNFDPANNLYIMAFSGARGNMSQVRQLVGMRGLMSDQEGKIIDLPIQANFREGLSSIDYIISSYGARKGIVDTALKTADSGYLTRRLIYVAQDLIIREIDCKTKKGILIFFTKKTNPKNLYGRYLLSLKGAIFPYSSYEDDFISKDKNILGEEMLTPLLIQKIKKLEKNFLITIRSPLTCQAKSSLCQKCYGWDLANNKVISLGEAIGIIAAQSIGEPGTQLTMRTFHTGGIFTGETLKQITAPFSGKIIIPETLKTIPYRTNHGLNVLKLKEKSIVKLINWEGTEEKLILDNGSYLYINKSSFIPKETLIAEFPKQSILPGPRRLKPIYTTISGELRFEKITLHSIKKSLGMIKVVVNNGVLWLTSGTIFILPKEIKYNFPRSFENSSLKALEKNKSFAKLKIISPKNGLLRYDSDSESLSIISFKKNLSLTLKLNSIKKKIENCKVEFVPISKNFQYIDKYSIIGFLYLFPLFSSTIHLFRYKKSTSITTLFLITNKDVWTINSEQINNYSFFPNKKTLVRYGIAIDNTAQLNKAGLFLKKDGFNLLFQHAVPIFLRRGTILNYKQGDFVPEKKILATLVNYTQQTEDIVQGLPKIEELIEARRPILPCFLSIRPGVILKHRETIQELENDKNQKIIDENELKEIKDNKNKNFILSQVLIKNTIWTKVGFYETINTNGNEIKNNLQENKIARKNFLSIIHSIFLKNEAISISSKEDNLKDGKFYRKIHLPTILTPASKNENYLFKIDKYTDEIIEKQVETTKENKINFLKEVEKEENLHMYGKKTFNIHDLHIPGKKNYSIWTKGLLKRPTSNKSLLNSYNFNFNSEHLNPTKLSNDFSIYRNDKKDYILEIKKDNYLFLEQLNPIINYELPLSSRFALKPGAFVDIGEPITEGIIDIHELLHILFNYHFLLDGTQQGVLKSLNKFQILLVNSIQAIYQSQGVNISSKHIEIIIKQMTCKVRIKNGGDTPLLPGEFVHFSLINELSLALKETNQFRAKIKKIRSTLPIYEPKLLSATTSSLSKDGFLSSAGFQETRRVLTKAAIEGTSDWLRGLKECVIIGRLIPAGSSFLNYKNYLDNLYLFKN